MSRRGIEVGGNMESGVLVEVSALPASSRQIGPVDRAWESLDQAQGRIDSAISTGIAVALRGAESGPADGEWQISELEISFGVKVTAEAGVIVSSVGGEASIEVKVHIARRGVSS